jgi:uncharacterized protein YbjT (DUF2867 family)
MTGALVAVTGATGKQGGAVVRHLLRAGWPVRALTRDASSAAARALTNAGAQVQQADSRNLDSLAAAFKGAWGVFSMQNYWEAGVGYAGEIEQGRNIALACQGVGVQHLVQSTIATAATFSGVRHFESKFEVEQAVKATALPRTFVGTTWFMDNLLDAKLGGSMTFPTLQGSLHRETRLPMMAVDDLGGVVAAVLQTAFTSGSHAAPDRVDIVGDALTVAQMKQAYRDITGRAPKWYSLPKTVLRWINPDFAAQLAWTHRVGWHIDPRPAKALYPALTDFATFLTRHQIKNL